MRLINAKTLELKEFFDDSIPDYVILSHRWGEDEVTYEEYIASKHQDGPGFQKIVDLCRLAREGIVIPGQGKQAFAWTWIDTVCIDKRSSAELSEAINSMYEWYRKSQVCLVFLPDVMAFDEHPDVSENTDFIGIPGHSKFIRKDLVNSAWSTRGWTLQELLAPEYVMFYAINLRTLGHKQSVLLSECIAEATRIRQDVVMFHMDLYQYSTAQKLSWAAHRQTSRAEDMAYCLMGLCEVNMPLLYGEGLARAFRRLQLEIIATKSDETIFAFSETLEWQIAQRLGVPIRTTGMLARYPMEYAHCGDIGPLNDSDVYRVFTRTQRGLEFEVLIPEGIRPRYSAPRWEHEAWYARLMVSYQRKDARCPQPLTTYVIVKVFQSPFYDGCMKAMRLGTVRVPNGNFETHRRHLNELCYRWRPLEYSPNPRSLDAQQGLDHHFRRFLACTQEDFPFHPLSSEDRLQMSRNDSAPAKLVRLFAPL